MVMLIKNEVVLVLLACACMGAAFVMSVLPAPGEWALTVKYVGLCLDTGLGLAIIAALSAQGFGGVRVRLPFGLRVRR